MDPAVSKWIAALPVARRAEVEALVALFAAESGCPARMWGSMAGFGRYGYVYPSGRRGESFAAGLAVRGREIALYILSGDAPEALARLGPHRAGKGCVHVRSLAGIDQRVLAALVRTRVADVAAAWPLRPV